MRLKFLIIPSALLFQFAGAQNGSAAFTTAQATVTTPASAASSTPVTPPVAEATPESPAPARTSILDYKSVYEATTIEEEVKMAADRFDLTPSQQDVWLDAAVDRRATEKFAREKLETKDPNLEKEGVYRGLRSSQNTFYETVIGHLTPTQKQAFENDRLILQEKQKKLAKMPPAPPTPTVTVATVDSSAIKSKEKKTSKKPRKKKKAVGQ